MEIQLNSKTMKTSDEDSSLIDAKAEISSIINKLTAGFSDGFETKRSSSSVIERESILSRSTIHWNGGDTQYHASY